MKKAETTKIILEMLFLTRESKWVSTIINYYSELCTVLKFVYFLYIKFGHVFTGKGKIKWWSTTQTVRRERTHRERLNKSRTFWALLTDWCILSWNCCKQSLRYTYGCNVPFTNTCLDFYDSTDLFGNNLPKWHHNVFNYFPTLSFFHLLVVDTFRFSFLFKYPLFSNKINNF